MKISLNWLKDFINVDIPINELEQKLSKQSTEVTQVLNQTEKYKNIVVGEIVALRKHKNADKLQVATINIGGKKIQVACSAKNIKEGQHVPVCLDGAVVPSTYKTKEEFVVKKMDFRGEMSEGMMCSERELDLGDDHTGIYILDENTEVGATLSEALELDDIILDLDLQSNQGYCMSHVGIAREIAALLNISMNWEPSELNLPQDSTENELKIEIKNEDLCSRYTGIIMEGIKIAPSPLWMQNRLRAAGMRPINNVVDVTNYILLEIGQPMHAFDYDKIAKKNKIPTIIVRESKKGEVIRSLDEKDHELPEGVLLIADVDKPIAVAGIIGGENTEIDDKTTKIVLESANFNAIKLRTGSRKLATRTDAVSRFEKNLDPNLTMIGLKRAVELLLEITEGKVVSKVVDVYPKPVKPITLTLPYERTSKVLGMEIEKETQIKNLELLGFEVDDQGEQMAVTVPTVRRDIKRPIDLIEEIIRIYGYDNVPLEYPLVPQKPSPLNPKTRLIRKLQNAMIGLGYYEIQAHSMVGEKLLNDCNMEVGEHIKIINPQAPEKEYMRMSLLPSLIWHTKENQKVNPEIKHFEIQKVFHKNYEYKAEDRLDTYAFEPQQLTAVWGGENLSYYDAKGVVEAILKNLNIENVEYTANDGSIFTSKIFHPTRSAIVKVGNSILGIIGELHPQVIENNDMEGNNLGLELDVIAILDSMPEQTFFKEFSRYQAVSQDLSLLVIEATKFKEITDLIVKTSPLVQKVSAVDQYRGEGIEKGKKSLTIRLVMQAEDRTLSPEEIEEARTKILSELEKRVKAKLR